MTSIGLGVWNDLVPESSNWELLRWLRCLYYINIPAIVDTSFDRSLSPSP